MKQPCKISLPVLALKRSTGPITGSRRHPARKASLWHRVLTATKIGAVGLALLVPAVGHTQDVFVRLTTSSTSSRSTVTPTTPAGASYNAAAPLPGTKWNFVTTSGNQTADEAIGTYTIYSSGSSVLVDPVAGTNIPQALTMYLYVPKTETSHSLSSSTGENTIQSSGVMATCIRNYENGTTFSTSSSTYVSNNITGLPASTPFDLYWYGGTTVSGYGGGTALVPANVLGANVSSNGTVNTTANGSGAYGSIWAGTSPNFSLLAQGTTWNVLHGQSDTNGNFNFIFGAGGNYAYYNGFQLIRVPVTYTVTGGGTNCTGSAVGLSGSETAATYQLYTNGVASGSAVSGTGSALSFGNVAVSATCTVIASLPTGAAETMTGNAVVYVEPATTVSAATPGTQTVPVGTTVTISVTTGGTTPTGYVWEKNGVTLSDGSTGNGGSTYSGSATATLTITDAQTGDSATAGQGYTCTVVGGCSSPTSTEATLSVTTANTLPSILGLANQSVLAGTNLTVSAIVSGVPTPAVQWFVSTNSGTSSNIIAGATTSSLTLTNLQYAQNNYEYILVATNVVGSVASNLTLTITQIAPTISPLTNLTLTAGFTASFTPAVTGAPAPVCQWQFNGSNLADGLATNGATISGSASSALSIINAQIADSGTYSLIATNTAGRTTNTVTLTVTAPTSLFVQLLVSGGANATTTNNPPSGYDFSAAAPAPGTVWNTIGRSVTTGGGLAPGTYPLYTGLALKDSSNNLVAPTLSIYFVDTLSNLASEPSSSYGENTIQPGGVMADTWRDYDNGHGGSIVFTVSNLPPSTPYALYFYGGTTGSGQGVSVQLATNNIYSTNAFSGSTTNTVANSNGSYGSLWNGTGPYTLMPQYSTWNVLYGQSDTNGNLTFLDNGLGNDAYFNGFQLVPVSALLPVVVTGGSATFTPGGVGLAGDGNIQFHYTGTAGQNYRIWATTNLTLSPITNTWTQLTNATFGSGTNLFEDSVSTNFPQRFYIITIP